MAGFTPDRLLEEKVLGTIVQPYVEDVAKRVAVDARRLAPGTKLWLSKADGRVRPTHMPGSGAHGQTVPENLRFAVKSMDWDRKHRGLGDYTYMLEPRDESSRGVVNLINCRCSVLRDPQGISRNIKVEAPLVTRKRVTVKVVCEGNLVIQAEFGDLYTGGLYAEGTRFMGRASRLATRW